MKRLKGSYLVMLALLLSNCGVEPETIQQQSSERVWIEVQEHEKLDYMFKLHTRVEDTVETIKWQVFDTYISTAGKADVLEFAFKDPGLKMVVATAITISGDTLIASVSPIAGDLAVQPPSASFFDHAKVVVNFLGDHVKYPQSSFGVYSISSNTTNTKATTSNLEDRVISWEGEGNLFAVHFSPGRGSIDSLMMGSYHHSESTDWIEHFSAGLKMPAPKFEGANDSMAVYSYRPLGDAESGHPEFDFNYNSYSVHTGHGGSGLEYKGTIWGSEPKPLVQIVFVKE